jgi:hypothetical protein
MRNLVQPSVSFSSRNLFAPLLYCFLVLQVDGTNKYSFRTYFDHSSTQQHKERKKRSYLLDFFSLRRFSISSSPYLHRESFLPLSSGLSFCLVLFTNGLWTLSWFLLLVSFSFSFFPLDVHLSFLHTHPFHPIFLSDRQILFFFSFCLSLITNIPSLFFLSNLKLLYSTRIHLLHLSLG